MTGQVTGTGLSRLCLASDGKEKSHLGDGKPAPAPRVGLELEVLRHTPHGLGIPEPKPTHQYWFQADGPPGAAGQTPLGEAHHMML